MKNISSSFIWLIPLLLLSACSHKAPVIVKKIDISQKALSHIPLMDTPSPSPPPITIWIYGTLLVKKSYFFDCFNGKMGLKKAQEFVGKPKRPGYIAQAISQQDPQRFPLDTFYFFGWSGKLCNHERLHAAEVLYTELQTLIEEYIQYYGTYPVITIMCHSHGGNIALYLAYINHIKSCNNHPLFIDSLVLLACPVQRCTLPFIYDSIFGSLYALYSSLDVIQVLAPQHPYYRPFSSKRFPPLKRLLQAKIMLNNHAIFHTSFSKKPFVTAIPSILQTLQHMKQYEFFDWFISQNGTIILSLKS